LHSSVDDSNFAIKKRDYGNNTRLYNGVAEAIGRTGTAHLWHEDDERCVAEDGRTATETHFGKNDN
jgi:hypothetical protein